MKPRGRNLETSRAGALAQAAIGSRNWAIIPNSYGYSSLSIACANEFWSRILATCKRELEDQRPPLPLILTCIGLMQRHGETEGDELSLAVVDASGHAIVRLEGNDANCLEAVSAATAALKVWLRAAPHMPLVLAFLRWAA